MLIPVPPSECMRAREAVSGRIDGELTELETTRLEAHLRRCPACREYAAATAAFTVELRRAPLEVPPAPVFAARRRRRVARVAQLRMPAAAAAVAVAVAAAGSLALGRMVGGGGTERVATSVPGEVSSVRQDSSEQHLLALLPRTKPQKQLRNGPIVPL